MELNPNDLFKALEELTYLKNINENIIKQTDSLKPITEIFKRLNKTGPIFRNVEVISSLIVSITALGIALFSEKFKQWSRKSKLCIEKVSGLHIQDNIPPEGKKIKLSVGRVLVENKGRYKAGKVEVNVISIEDKNGGRRNFLPSPLNWTHSQLYSENRTVGVIRDIHPHQSVYLDIFNLNTGEENSKILKLAVVPCSNIDDFSKLEIGENTIVLKFYQESGQTITKKLKIIWDGKDSPRIETIN